MKITLLILFGVPNLLLLIWAFRNYQRATRAEKQAKHDEQWKVAADRRIKELQEGNLNQIEV